MWAASSICLEVDISDREDSGSRLPVQVLRRLDVADHLWRSAFPLPCTRQMLSWILRSPHSSFRSHWGPQDSPPSVPRPWQCDCSFFCQDMEAISLPLESDQGPVIYLDSQNAEDYAEEMKTCQVLLQACLLLS